MQGRFPPESIWIRAGLPLIAVLACTAVLPAHAQMPSERLFQRAAPEVPVVERHGEWLLACSPHAEKNVCQFQPGGFEALGDASVALVIVPNQDDGEAPVMILRSPLGVLLSTGIALEVDGRSIGRLAFQTCEADGCVAPAKFEGALASAMRSGTALEAELILRDGSSSRTRFSLMGVTAGLRAMQAAH